MATNHNPQGGPSQGRKDEPTEDRDNRKAQSREELQERTARGEEPGRGRRNGSDKNR
jgi:hypothetical protein